MTKHVPCRRAALIALGTAHIHRAAVCRLGAEIDQWLGVSSNGAIRDLAARLGLPATQLRRAVDLVRHAEPIASAEIRGAKTAAGRIVTRVDPGYPSVFREMALPPPALYVRGEVRNLTRAPAVAMVGARNMDAYGRACARRFARALAAAGITVVSGFARGVDQTAHRGALEAEGGRTVAVLGCGIDVDYPARSRDLATRVAENGALISELPIGAEPRPFHFPLRNRLIATLGIGVLVVQARCRSGSLITAHHAMELGREVWAIPGPIDRPLSGGPNGLIADGAFLVESPDDILDVLPLATQEVLFPSTKTVGRADRRARPTVESPEVPPKPPVTLPPGPAGAVLAALPAGEARSPDAIAQTVGLGTDRVLGILLELELAGHVRRRPGPAYARTDP